MQSSKPRKQIFGRQRQLKDILATHESNVINTTGLETKTRTKDEVFGERIKPDDIQSRIFTDLRPSHDQYFKRTRKEIPIKSREVSPL